MILEQNIILQLSNDRRAGPHILKKKVFEGSGGQEIDRNKELGVWHEMAL